MFWLNHADLSTRVHVLGSTYLITGSPLKIMCILTFECHNKFQRPIIAHTLRSAWDEGRALHVHCSSHIYMVYMMCVHNMSIKVSSKTKHVVHYNVKCGDIIIWEFATKKRDIGFGELFAGYIYMYML